MRQSSDRSGSCATPATALLPTRLPVSRPADAAEKQADLIAERVGAAPSAGFTFDGMSVYPLSPAGGDDPLRSRLEQRSSRGNPLPSTVRMSMESSFGADFGRVRIHTDDEAARISGALQAEAFTFGRDIYFGTSAFDAAGRGRRLLAHELAHTLQQQSSGPQIHRSCHPVAAKQTLTSIAGKYSVTVAALAEANDLTVKAVLPVGTVLVIPDGKPCQHTVAKNDTLYSIARTFNASVDEIKTANKLNSDVIKEGDVLSIPTSDASGADTYKVALKDTLFSIAQAHKVTVDEIKALNGLKGDDIIEGQELKIPRAKAATATKPTTTAPATKAPTTKAPATKPAPTTTSTTAPSTAAPTVAASASSDPGHNPGVDYASGTMRERSFLRAADKTTKLKSGKAELFFEAGSAVKRISSSVDWVEVEGNAFTNLATPAKAGKHKGWVQRKWTSMTLGDYKDLPVEDLTRGYGALSSGTIAKSAVNNVILHQTGSATGAPTLADYEGRIKKGSTIGAHYLIDEKGSIKLVVPVNQKVSHVGKTKAGFETAGNPNAIGIEHSGKPLALDLPSSATDTTTLTANRTAIKAFAIAPSLKARITAMTDKELFALGRANFDKKAGKWFVYGDLNARQKRSSYLLNTRLMADFKLDENDLLAHETASWKTVGEGENIKEFLTARAAYPGLVKTLSSLIKGDAKLSADAALGAVLAGEQETVDALAKDATESENKDVAAEKAGTAGKATARENLRVRFYQQFWTRITQLTALVTFLKNSGSGEPAALKKKTSAWVK